MSGNLSKDALREQAKFHRDRLDVLPEMGEQAAALFIDFLTKNAVKKNIVIAGYWPIQKEFDVRPCLDEARKAGYTVCLPKTNAKATPLTFVEWNEQSILEQGRFGIMEPKAGAALFPDLLLVPLLAFDLRGHRMGYGQGHYDATIAALKDQKPVTTIGVGYAAQAVLFNLPTEDHDEPLEYILTERELRRFE